MTRFTLLRRLVYPLSAVFQLNGHLNCIERGTSLNSGKMNSEDNHLVCENGLLHCRFLQLSRMRQNSGPTVVYSNFVCNRQCNHDNMKSTNTEL